MQLFSSTQALDLASQFLEKHPNGIIEILGPTGSGKTGFSITVAKHLQHKAEVISVDSRQVFRECDISSAKITTEEMQGVPHHGLDLVNLDQDYNVVQFQQYAFETIEAIQDRGHVPILCGGTMLWLDAVSENYVFSTEQRHNQTTDQPEFTKSNKKSSPKWPVLKLGLHWDREILYERINQRAVQQFETGLIEETKTVLAKYPSMTRSAFTSFGYQEIQQYLDGDTTYEEALAANQKRNRNYAKRQLTWWRGREDVVWIRL